MAKESHGIELPRALDTQCGVALGRDETLGVRLRAFKVVRAMRIAHGLGTVENAVRSCIVRVRSNRGTCF